MRAPSFWNQKNHPFSFLLAPFGNLYSFLGNWYRRRQTPLKLSIPVICVGNIVLGGAGKTPVALWLARTLQQQGYKVHFLTRGYKGSAQGPLLVQSNHSFQEVGDEALLLSQRAPTWVAKDRRQGAQAAQARGAEILILDDGFQNPTLVYDLALMVIDTSYGLGNGQVFPAGPLREKVSQALHRAQGIILMGPYPCPVETSLPTLRFLLDPKKEDLEALRGQRVLPFAGLGRPQKFFTMLQERARLYDFHLLPGISFPDHHAYTPQDLKKLDQRAQAQQAQLVTTAKDAIKLPADVNIKVISLDLKLIEGDFKQMWPSSSN